MLVESIALDFAQELKRDGSAFSILVLNRQLQSSNDEAIKTPI